jgi:hypothetical protein
LMSQLLGASISGDPSKKDDAGGLGAFDLIVPSDIKNQAAMRTLQQQAATSDNPQPDAGGSMGSDSGTGQAPGSGGSDPGASADGQRLISNTARVQFQNTAGGLLAKQDIADGKIAPNVVFVLSVLAGQMAFTISCAASDLAGHRNQGHASGSLHYQYRAVDIVDLIDPKTNTSVHIANNPTSPLVRQALDIINTITGPRRPDQVISYVKVPYTGFFQANDHWNHIHLGTHTWGEAAPPPQVTVTPGTRVNS